MAESAQPAKPQHCNSTAATLIYPFFPLSTAPMTYPPPSGPLPSHWSYHFPTTNIFGINTPHTRSSIIPHPPAYEDGTDREFRNVGSQRYVDAGDLPKRQQITISTSNNTDGNLIRLSVLLHAHSTMISIITVETTIFVVLAVTADLCA